MPEDALTVLETSSQRRIELDSLVVSATECFRIIEPWNAARSDHAAVTPIITSVQKQGVAYYKALDLSIVTAQNGYTFSSDAELLCDFLLDEANTADEIMEFITDMREIAQRAHKDALEMSELFRSVRQGLFQITKGIPVEVAKLEEEERRARELKANSQRNATRCKNATAVVVAGSTAISAGIAIGLAFPPVILFLPVFLPLIGVIGSMAESSCVKDAEHREKQAIQCSEAMKQLQQAASDISALVIRVDKFSDWWLEQDTMLKALGDKVEQLEPGRIRKLRIKSIKTGWGEVKGSYLEYKTKVSRLQDYYPSSRLVAEGNVSLLGEAAQRRMISSV